MSRTRASNSPLGADSKLLDRNSQSLAIERPDFICLDDFFDPRTVRCSEKYGCGEPMRTFGSGDGSPCAAAGELGRLRVVPVGPDKVPRLRRWPERAVPVTDRETIREWFARWPDCALALVTGPESGVLVLDVDAPGEAHAADGFAALRALERKLGPLPATAEARTPSGGRHLLFRWPAGIGRIPSKPLRPGLDVKASGGAVTLPCGRRTPGREWARHPREGIANLPERWRRAIVPRPMPRYRMTIEIGERDCDATRERLAERADEVARAAAGTRNQTLYRHAFWAATRAREGTLSWHEAETLLAAAGRAAGLRADEIQKTLSSARRGAER